jgi:hypothetical protein
MKLSIYIPISQNIHNKQTTNSTQITPIAINQQRNRKRPTLGRSKQQTYLECTEPDANQRAGFRIRLIL